MIGISIANSLGLNKLSAGINPDAAAFIAAAGITGTTQVDAVNALVNGLQTDGIWTKMKAVYPFVTDNRNLASYTEDFSNANWIKNNGATITTNTTTAPDGTTSADTLQVSTTIYSGLYEFLSGGSGDYSVSIFAKKLTKKWLYLFDASATNSAWFDLENGVLGTVPSGYTASIENVGDGWYRCIIKNNSAVSPAFFQLGLSDANASYTPTSSGTAYVWGAQLEKSPTATTYQPIATTQQAYIASQFKYNLKDPRDLDAAFRLVFNGGWTHSSNGALPNGTNGYANTYFAPLTQNIGLNSFAFGVYCRNDITSLVAFGVTEANKNAYLVAKSSFGLYNGVNDAESLTTPNWSTGTGLFTASRTNSTQVKLFQNSTAKTRTANSLGITNGNMYLGAYNSISSAAPLNFSSIQFAFNYIADGLSDTEASNLYTRVQAFQTALSRQV